MEKKLISIGKSRIWFGKAWICRVKPLIWFGKLLILSGVSLTRGSNTVQNEVKCYRVIFGNWLKDPIFWWNLHEWRLPSLFVNDSSTVWNSSILEGGVWTSVTNLITPILRKVFQFSRVDMLKSVIEDILIKLVTKDRQWTA